MPPPRTYSDPDVIARVTDLTLRSRRLVEGAISGQHRSPFHGFNVEFASYREYAPGDDLRRLDWRVFGRTDRYFVKQYEEESNLRATLVTGAIIPVTVLITFLFMRLAGLTRGRQPRPFRAGRAGTPAAV